MATIRQRRPGVWEVRGYTGRDREGNPTQVSRTVHGTKRDAQRVAAELTVKPARNAGGRKVGQTEVLPSLSSMIPTQNRQQRRASGNAQPEVRLSGPAVVVEPLSIYS